MKRLKEKYYAKTRGLLYDLWHYSHHAHEHFNNRSTSEGHGLSPDDFTRSKLSELMKEINEFSDRLYLLKKHWKDDLQALADVLTSEEGERYLEQADMPESLVKTVLSE